MLCLVLSDGAALCQHRSPFLKCIIGAICLTVVRSRLLLILALLRRCVAVLDLDLRVLLLLIELLLLPLLHSLLLLLLILLMHLLAVIWWELQALRFGLLLAGQSETTTLEAGCSLRTELLLDKLLSACSATALATVDL